MRGGFKFLAEVRHVHAEIVRVFVGIGAPYLAEDLPVRHNFAAVLHEEAEEGVLFCGEVDFLAGTADGARGKVDFDGADAHDGGFGGGLDAAQDGTDTREEFASAEWFGEIVVGPGVEGFDFIVFAGAHREHEHGDVAPFAEAAEDFDAADVGESEVEDDAVGLARGGFLQAEDAVFGFANGVAATFKRETQEAADLHFVVDDENGGGNG